MASIISAGTTSSTALNMSADTTGILQLASNNGTVALTIDTSQNFGIGVTNPSTYTLYKTTISVGSGYGLGILKPSAGSNSYLYFGYDSSGSGMQQVAIGSISDALNFFTGGTSRMSITSSGNIAASNAILTIGDNTRTVSSSTTTGAIVCGGGLGVWSTINAGGSGNFSDTVSVFSQNPSTTQQGILFRNTFNTGASIFSMGAATSNGLIAFIGGSGTQGGISGNGAGISYTSASDYRLKENVAPMIGALAKVAQLKPCTYTWKFDGSDGQGFIAHELQEMFPDAVTGKKDDVEIYTDEDGNEKTKIKPQGVDTSFLVATLTAAIQELNKKVTDLEEQVLNLGVK